MKYKLCLLLFFLFFADLIKSNEQNINKFVLITVLYNETHEQRRQEYITCLEQNLIHSAIWHVHVVYDTSKDDKQNILLEYLKQKNISISYVHERPSFGFCFELANTQYPNRRILLSNADIFFNHTLFLLQDYDLTNKFLALTRWNVLCLNCEELKLLPPLVLEQRDLFWLFLCVVAQFDSVL